MIVNLQLLDGATMEHNGIFYTAGVDGDRLVIRETFTGIRCASSESEVDVMRAMMTAIKEQDQPGTI